MKTINAISLSLVAWLLSSAVLNATERPNIIIIYADDVGYGDLGCYGAEAIDTPSLNRLAEQGARFTAAYATSSTCTPSRYSLLTGEYAFRNQRAKILPGNAPLIIAPSKPTLPSVLKQAGYATGLVGKWHLGLGHPDRPLDWNGRIEPGPRELGFDYSFHMAATGDRVPTVYIENGKVRNLDPNDPISVSYQDIVGNDPTGLSHPHLLRNQADEQHAKTIVDGTSRIGYMSGGQSARWTDEEMPDAFLNKAIEFVREQKDNPFFLFYAFHENHVPRVPHPRFVGSTSLGARGDAVVQMDWSIGRLVEELEELGIAKNTLILFSSDNGPVLFDGYYDGAREMNGDHRAAGPWRGGKYSPFEGGTRLPLIAWWPERIQPGLSSAVISQVDMLASLAALAGAELPENSAQDSMNLLSVLLGEGNEGRDHVVQQSTRGLSIRKGDWKYIEPGSYREAKTGVDAQKIVTVAEIGALYYLPEDPGETTDLAAQYPRIAQEMDTLLKRIQSDRN